MNLWYLAVDLGCQRNWQTLGHSDQAGCSIAACLVVWGLVEVDSYIVILLSRQVAVSCNQSISRPSLKTPSAALILVENMHCIVWISPFVSSDLAQLCSGSGNAERQNPKAVCGVAMGYSVILRLHYQSNLPIFCLSLVGNGLIFLVLCFMCLCL